ncbi:MAG: hypothetical protein M3068_02425 [Gemmatimonadota bacterium]|nr:hypothetical protein [Gemmatimonadota bacterium]
MISRVVIALVLVFVVAASAHAQGHSGTPAMPHDRPSSGSAIRNPKFLRAAELLSRSAAGVAPRIRFEWEQVPGSAEYVLTGQWTGAQSWALQSREYRVTARNASTWTPDRVTFDVSLPEGSYSWKLVAVFGPNDVGDFVTPAQLSFDVR